MRHTLLVLLACNQKEPADAPPEGEGDADTDADSDSDSDADTDADPGDALADGFEAGLSEVLGCQGSFWAFSRDGDVVLSFDANDLAGEAFLAGEDRTWDLDLAVEGDRLRVVVGENVGLDVCSLDTSAPAAFVYAPTSGLATLTVEPHQTQPENSTGSVVLDTVVLEASGAPAVTLGHLELGPMQFVGP